MCIRDRSQKSHVPPPELKLKAVTEGHLEVLKTSGSLTWNPNDDLRLISRLCVVAHTGRGGHRGYESTLNTLDGYCWWSSMKEDVKSFVKHCLLCVSTTGGLRVPRPYGHALHATKPNEILHFDYLYIGAGDRRQKYVLILKDDLSGYVWLEPSAVADATTAADTLMSWFSRFGVCETMVSDQGSHFKNQLIERLASEYAIKHHFTHPYTPWANGTVEVVCREVLRCLRALLAEFRLGQKEWPRVLPIVQSVLNNSPLKRIKGKAPITAFTGLSAYTPLRSVMTSRSIEASVLTLEKLRAEQLVEVELTMAAMDDMHREVALSNDHALVRRELKFTTDELMYKFRSSRLVTLC